MQHFGVQSQCFASLFYLQGQMDAQQRISQFPTNIIYKYTNIFYKPSIIFTKARSSELKFSVALPIMRASIMDPLDNLWKYLSQFPLKKLHASSLPCATPCDLYKIIHKNIITIIITMNKTYDK